MVPQGDTAGAETEVHFEENPELSKSLSFKPGLGQNITYHASPTARNSGFLFLPSLHLRKTQPYYWIRAKVHLIQAEFHSVQAEVHSTQAEVRRHMIYSFSAQMMVYILITHPTLVKTYHLANRRMYHLTTE